MNRFWSKVDKTEYCWNWTASIRGNSGYGAFKLDGRVQSAHRVSWYLEYNEWPNGLVCHICDNRLCVRPEHLFVGTHYDNNLDAINKGRITPVVAPRIDTDIEQYIVSKYQPGVYGYKKIAKDLNMSYQTVRSVLKRQ